VKIGLSGFPFSGRKTLFFILTSRQCKDEGIQQGVFHVPDARIDEIAHLAGATKKTYPQYTVVLTPPVDERDTKKSWIEPLRECDLLCLVVRAFHSPEVYHPRGTVDPQRDQRALKEEIMLADLDIIEKRLNTLTRMESSGSLTPANVMEQKALELCKSGIETLNSPVLNQYELSAIA